MLRVVTWKWDSGIHPKKKIKFGAEHVNILARMVKRNLDMEHEFVCITDDAEGIDESIRVVPLWDDFRDMGGCFVRLKSFAQEMKRVIGPRFVSMDLDTVIVDDITPILDRPEDEFIIWGEHDRGTKYCGSLYMMDAGKRQQVWLGFRPDLFFKNEKGRYPGGTDQVRITNCLYPNEKMWTVADGIFNFREDIWRPRLGRGGRAKLQRQRRKTMEVAIEKAGENAKQRAIERCVNEDSQARMIEKAIDKVIVRMLKREVAEREKVLQAYKDRKEKGTADGKLPDNARIVFFNGKFDPSDKSLQEQYPWIKENWK